VEKIEDPVASSFSIQIGLAGRGNGACNGDDGIEAASFPIEADVDGPIRPATSGEETLSTGGCDWASLIAVMVCDSDIAGTDGKLA
jgi:hypothetical protein